MHYYLLSVCVEFENNFFNTRDFIFLDRIPYQDSGSVNNTTGLMQMN